MKLTSERRKQQPLGVLFEPTLAGHRMENGLVHGVNGYDLHAVLEAGRQQGYTATRMVVRGCWYDLQFVTLTAQPS